MKKSTFTLSFMFLLAMFCLSSCGGGSGTTTQGAPATNGTLSLSLVDAPGGAYQAVYVTIGEVQVCIQDDACKDDDESQGCGCRWETIDTLNQTFNLLELVNGVMAHLGQKDLAAGTYRQMRLLLFDEADDTLNIQGNAHPFAQYLIDENGEVQKMKVPSGYQTGIKLVHPFEMVAGQTVELILDFDVARSVIKAGRSGKYILKPTIKVIGTHKRAFVSGLVTTDDDPAEPLEGATVTAWQEDEDGSPVVAMRTVTDPSGAYMLYLDLEGASLETKTYAIVASAEGYDAGCTNLSVAVDQSYPDIDFALPETTVVEVTGLLTGTAPLTAEDVYPAEAPIVTLSFSRQVDGCIQTPQETAFVQVTADDADNSYNSADGTFQYTYAIVIPEGLYSITAASEGLETQTAEDFNTDTGTLDFEFPEAAAAAP